MQHLIVLKYSHLKKGESISFGIDTVTEDNTYTIETSKGEKTADLTIVDEEARITDVSVPEDFIEVFVDKTISPKVSITPNNTINSNLEWYAVDDTIATVSDGIISGLKTGATQVYVKAMNKDDSVEEVSDTVTVIVSDKDKIFGDVNKDKAFNVSDLVNIEKWLLTGDGSVAVADFNDDGCVDTFDFIKYKQYYLYKNQKSK